MFGLISFGFINRFNYVSDGGAEFCCDCDPDFDWDVGSNGGHGWAHVYDLD